MMLRLLDRYIARELMGPFLFGVVAFTAILGGGTVLFPLVDKAVKHGLPFTLIVQIFIYKLPAIVVFTFPMSMLLAAILSFGRLSADSEIVAFRAAGIGVIRLVIPVVAIGMLVSIMTIGFNEAIVPKTSHYAEELLARSIQKDSPRIRKNVNFTEQDKEGYVSRIINVNEIGDNGFKGVTMAEYEKGHLARVMSAKTGSWIAGRGWQFQNGIMHQFSATNPKKIYVIEFAKELISISINPYGLQKREKQVEEMSALELGNRIELKQRLGKDTTSDRVNFHLKFAVPFTSLLFAILGASVGLRPHRSTSAMGLGVSLLIIIGYYILYSVGMGLGLSKVISPFLAAWVPNILVGTAGVVLLKKVAAQ